MGLLFGCGFNCRQDAGSTLRFTSGSAENRSWGKWEHRTSKEGNSRTKTRTKKLLRREDAGSTFQERTNTTCQLALPTHGFTVVLSVFGGTPPAKPFNCKIRLFVSSVAIVRSGAHHTGGEPTLAITKFNLPPDDITWTSLYSLSQFVSEWRRSQTAATSLLIATLFSYLREIKNPAYFSVSRVEKIFILFRTCLPPVYSNDYSLQ